MGSFTLTVDTWGPSLGVPFAWADHGPLPLALVALTRTVYSVPLASPVMM